MSIIKRNKKLDTEDESKIQEQRLFDLYKCLLINNGNHSTYWLLNEACTLLNYYNSGKSRYLKIKI